MQKNKAVPFVKSFFSEEIFSSSDHLNVITRNINISFDYIVVKTRRNNDHHKAILQLRWCLHIYWKNIIEKVFILGKAVRLLPKAVF